MKITEDEQPDDEAPSNGTSNGAPSHGTPNSLPSHVMEQSMYGAIDAMMANAEQSYEEFMQSFIYLTPEDVLTVSGSQTRLGPTSSLSHDVSIPASHNSSAHLRQDKFTANTHVNDADSLDEEVLGAGTTCSVSHGTAVGKLKGLKIDNFVDDETSSLSDSDERLEDECLEYSGYQASFTCEHMSRKKGQNNSSKTPGSEPGCDSFTDSTQADAETTRTIVSTDDVINVTSLPLDVSADQDSDTLSDLVYDQRLDRLNPGEVDTGGEQSDVKDVNFRTMGYSARPGESLQCKDGTHLPEVNCDMSAETTDGADCTCALGKEGDDVITYEAVQPFVLDEDFDYDNVILTPKYTVQEMDQIMCALEKGPVYVSPPSSDPEEDS